MKNQTLDNQNLIGASSGAIEVSPFVAAAASSPAVADGINGSEQPDDIGIASTKSAPVSPGAAPMAAGDFQDLSDSQNNLIKSPAGMFWCYCHLQDLPVEKQSIDKRFCTRCYEILVDEAKGYRAAGGTRTPWWHPYRVTAPRDSRITLAGHELLLVMPPNRGKNSKLMPMELIMSLHLEGKKNNAIANILTGQGFTVSDRTIGRILNKQGFVNSKLSYKNGNPEEILPQGNTRGSGNNNTASL